MSERLTARTVPEHWSEFVRCDRCGDLHAHVIRYEWSDGHVELVCRACSAYDQLDPGARSLTPGYLHKRAGL